MTARIPAWKKLGLQLKNSATSATEADTALPVTPITSSPSKATKKRPLTSESEEPNGKKQRVENGTVDDEAKREDAKKNANGKIAKKKGPSPELKSSIELSSVEQQQDDKPSSKLKSKKRKSVSFAADTKSEDGNEDAELEFEYQDEDDHEPSPAAARKAEKKKLKREQRAKDHPSPNSSSMSDATPTDPVLQYLTLYHKYRAQWKFQKNRETHLLKHALSVDRIPSTYNASLAAYLAGIKGEGAKKRVAEVAVEAIKADDADVDSEKNSDSDASEKDRYRNAIASFRKLLPGQGADPDSWEGDMVGDEATDLNADWLKKLEKRRRAELVLHFVGGSVPTAGAAESQAQPKPVVNKKKKNRTAVVEDTSSSGSSESDSDSDSDSDDATSKPAINQVNGTKSGLQAGSSSPSETSSSSDSSSNSDSGSETSSDSDSD
ncbi:hypothetical protein EMCG_02966 [[Emmonsia] crescens]|uniref:WKF domain-containing protein n=1 Tax=[Emmonsia] crescens TaxID=73230 RepID=A0A0G2HXP2_9EURO|nr:hypothetical protein EMCG_02966 [Emmonsia crescens UAMH 3008]